MGGQYHHKHMTQTAHAIYNHKKKLSGKSYCVPIATCKLHPLESVANPTPQKQLRQSESQTQGLLTKTFLLLIQHVRSSQIAPLFGVVLSIATPIFGRYENEHP